MDWLAQNWFWVALVGLFMGMHLFGHGGCCGGHAHHNASSDESGNKPTAPQQ